MKFCTKNPYWLNCHARKLLLVMNLTTFLLIATIMQVSAGSFAQNITLTKNNITLDQFFREIRKQTGYSVYYSDKVLNDNNIVNVEFKATPIEEALKIVLEGKSLSFDIKDRNITIFKAEKTFPDKIVDKFNTIDIRGHVVDEKGSSMRGVTIKVKDGNQATTTDKDGNFLLRKVDEKAVIVISSVGYLTKEVNSASNLGTITLEISNSKLDEVQVIAYGTTTQRLNTGNVSTIKAVDIEKQPVTNPLLALQGRVPGLQITQASGFSGTGVTVAVQGQNSIGKGNEPFYVIDGVPYPSQLLPNMGNVLGRTGINSAENGNPLSFINPSDIESISVLKDADATAIYGSQAANGAILITTKKGKAGQTQVDVNLQQGIGKVNRSIKLLNTQQYLAMRKEAYKNDNIDYKDPSQAYAPDLTLWDQSRYTDWQNELLGGTAQYSNFNTSISGGSINTQYYLGATYHRETVVFPGDFSDRKAAFHANVNSSSPNQKFRVQFLASYLFDDNKLPNEDMTGRALQIAPNSPALYNADGTLNWMPDASGSSTFQNPLADFQKKYTTLTASLVSNVSLNYVLFPGFEIRSNLGYTNLQNRENVLLPLTTQRPEDRPFGQRISGYGNSNINTWNIEPLANYSKTMGKSKLEVLMGVTIKQTNSHAQRLTGIGFISDDVMEDILSARQVIPTFSTESIYRYNALFGRINYIWDNKIIANITSRRDGSSRFGKENSFHNFSAIGIGWVFTEQDFVKNKLSFLSFGKLKVSYGTTGNDQIGDYKYLNKYVTLSQDVPYQGGAAIIPDGDLSNPYLQWEETKKLNAGIDLNFLKDRIAVSLNYFRNRSSNQLLNYALPSMAGGGLTRNFPATVQNAGWELTLTGSPIKGANFNWNSSFNLTVPKNKLVAFPNQQNSSYATTYIIGKSISTNKLYHALGVNPETGIYQFADRNGNPTSTPDFNTDAVVLVDRAQQYFGGLSNTFRYKDLSLDVLFQFVKQIGENNYFGLMPGFYFNQPVSVLDRWQKEGDNAPIQRYSAGFNYSGPYGDMVRGSDAGIADASYIKLRNLSLSWVLPSIWSNKIKARNASLFLLGQNLLTITKYKGLDPETQSSNTLPSLRVWTMGIKLGL
jgi:TonB-linked SusC/RagA family outer membrane protein